MSAAWTPAVCQALAKEWETHEGTAKAFDQGFAHSLGVAPHAVAQKRSRCGLVGRKLTRPGLHDYSTETLIRELQIRDVVVTIHEGETVEAAREARAQYRRAQYRRAQAELRRRAKHLSANTLGRGGLFSSVE